MAGVAKYLSAKETAAEWGASPRRVTILAEQGSFKSAA